MDGQTDIIVVNAVFTYIRSTVKKYEKFNYKNKNTRKAQTSIHQGESG